MATPLSATRTESATPGSTTATLGLALLRVAAACAVGFLVTVGVGKLSLVGWVKTIDEAVFSAAVGALQSIPGLVRACELLTDLGAIPVSWGMALGIAFVVGLQRRNILLPVLVLGTLFAALVFQHLTRLTVDGYAPVELVVGAAGPYFSGGVMRVVLLVGMAATLALRNGSEPWVWRLAIAFGLFEAMTRLVLGRHWPFDLVAAFPIGLGFLWAFRQLAAAIPESAPPVETA